MFGIDFEILIKRILPTTKRNAWHIDWLMSMTKGLQTLYTSFLAYREESLKQLSYNSQTLIFNKLLNDVCDNTLRRIYIDNTFDNKIRTHLFDKTENESIIYLYDKSEGKEPTYLYDTSEIGEDTDFIVFVPTELTNKEAQVRALVNKYKLSSTQYTIEYF